MLTIRGNVAEVLSPPSACAWVLVPFQPSDSCWSTPWQDSQFVPSELQFTEGKLKPGADKFASTLEDSTRKVTEEQMVPAAQRVADQAVPLAEKVTEEHLKPAAQKIADNVRIPATTWACVCRPMHRGHQYIRIVNAINLQMDI